MATIIRYSVPSVVASILPANVDINKLVNAVQSDLNTGSINKTSTKADVEVKTVKNPDTGHDMAMLQFKTKTSESLRCHVSIATRFYGFGLTLSNAAQYSGSDWKIELPGDFGKWIADKFMLPVKDKAS